RGVRAAGALAARLGGRRRRQPRRERPASGGGQTVRLLRPRPRSGAGPDPDVPGLGEPGELRVDLAVLGGPEVPDRRLHALGEVVAGRRPPGQQRQQGEAESRHRSIVACQSTVACPPIVAYWSNVVRRPIVAYWSNVVRRPIVAYRSIVVRRPTM